MKNTCRDRVQRWTAFLLAVLICAAMVPARAVADGQGGDAAVWPDGDGIGIGVKSRTVAHDVLGDDGTPDLTGCLEYVSVESVSGGPVEAGGTMIIDTRYSMTLVFRETAGGQQFGCPGTYQLPEGLQVPYADRRGTFECRDKGSRKAYEGTYTVSPSGLVTFDFPEMSDEPGFCEGRFPEFFDNTTLTFELTGLVSEVARNELVFTGKDDETVWKGYIIPEDLSVGLEKSHYARYGDGFTYEIRPKVEGGTIYDFTVSDGLAMSGNTGSSVFRFRPDTLRAVLNGTPVDEGKWEVLWSSGTGFAAAFTDVPVGPSDRLVLSYDVDVEPDYGIRYEVRLDNTASIRDASGLGASAMDRADVDQDDVRLSVGKSHAEPVDGRIRYTVRPQVTGGALRDFTVTDGMRASGGLGSCTWDIDPDSFEVTMDGEALSVGKYDLVSYGDGYEMRFTGCRFKPSDELFISYDVVLEGGAPYAIFLDNTVTFRDDFGKSASASDHVELAEFPDGGKEWPRELSKSHAPAEGTISCEVSAAMDGEYYDVMLHDVAGWGVTASDPSAEITDGIFGVSLEYGNVRAFREADGVRTEIPAEHVVVMDDFDCTGETFGPGGEEGEPASYAAGKGIYVYLAGETFHAGEKLVVTYDLTCYATKPTPGPTVDSAVTYSLWLSNVADVAAKDENGDGVCGTVRKADVVDERTVYPPSYYVPSPPPYTPPVSPPYSPYVPAYRNQNLLDLTKSYACRDDMLHYHITFAASEFIYSSKMTLSDRFTDYVLADPAGSVLNLAFAVYKQDAGGTYAEDPDFPLPGITYGVGGENFVLGPFDVDRSASYRFEVDYDVPLDARLADGSTVENLLDNGRQLVNSASFTHDTSYGTGRARAACIADFPAMAVEKTSDATLRLHPGETVTFRVLVKPTSYADVGAVTITDVLPEGLVMLPDSIRRVEPYGTNFEAVWSEEDRTLTVTKTGLARQDEFTVEYKAVVGDNEDDVSIANTAQVTGSNMRHDCESVSSVEVYGSVSAAAGADASDSAEVELSGRKAFDSIYDLRDGLFLFSIEPDAGNPETDPVAGGMVRNDGDGLIALTSPGPAVYTEAGTYVYTVREVQGSDPDVAYDSSEYTVTVDVSRTPLLKRLKADVSYLKDGEPVDGVEFVNVGPEGGVVMPGTGGTGTVGLCIAGATIALAGCAGLLAARKRKCA